MCEFNIIMNGKVLYKLKVILHIFRNINVPLRKLRGPWVGCGRGIVSSYTSQLCALRVWWMLRWLSDRLLFVRLKRHSCQERDGGFILLLLEFWGEITTCTGLYVNDSSDCIATGLGATAGTSWTAGAGVSGQNGEASDFEAALTPQLSVALILKG